MRGVTKVPLPALVILPLLGCGGPERQAEAERLPFTVRVRFEEPPAAQAGGGGPDAPLPAIPPRFDDPGRLTRELRKALEDSRLFTSVVIEEEVPEDQKDQVDLDLSVEALGSDFGPGRRLLLRSILSTVVWLFAGHAAWFIDNHTYPQSDLRLTVKIETARHPSPPQGSAGGGGNGGGREPIHQDTLPLSGLDLNFLERSDMARWFYNILLPPWWDDGDPRAAGASLTRRSLDYLARREPELIRQTIVEKHLRAVRCYLAYHPEEAQLRIVSQSDLLRVRITPDGGRPRSLRGMQVRRTLVEGEAELEQTRRWFAQKLVGSWDHPFNRYYRIKLLPGEVGYVRVEVFLESPEQEAPGRFTIYREPPPGPTPRS